LQENKQKLDEKEALIVVLGHRLKEMEAKYLREHKQNEILEMKLNAPSSSPTTPNTPTNNHHESKFSLFLSPKNKEREKEKENSFVSQATTDEERKKLLFEEYTMLLTEVNTAAFQKREALNELETKEGKKFLRKIPIANAKSAISKLESLQERTKKALRAVDEQAGILAEKESAEYANLKNLRNELENM